MAELSINLEPTSEPFGYASLANPVFARQLALRFCGQVIAAARKHPTSTVHFVTLASRRWWLSDEELEKWNPSNLLQQLRANLNRAGLSKLGGWFIAHIHGEYDPRLNVWKLHFHVLVVGEKIEAFRALRSLDIFQRSPEVWTPIVVQSVDDLARVATYLCQRFWPSRPTRVSPETGNLIRVRSRKRIQQPQHTSFLLLFDRLKFLDLTWLHGITIANGRLVAR